MQCGTSDCFYIGRIVKDRALSNILHDFVEDEQDRLFYSFSQFHMIK